MAKAIVCGAVMLASAMLAAVGVVEAVLPPAQMQALLDLHATAVWATPATPPAGWNSSTDPCNWRTAWQGVGCNSKGTAVTVLQLQGLTSSLRLPASLAALTSLNNLNLNSCGLRGTIPPELGTMAALRVLDLSLSTASPGGGLTGPIPPELGNLQNLSVLALGGNHLSGAIPSSFGLFEQLTSLDLSHNDLTGEVPQLDGITDSLVFFNVANNVQLTGDLTFLAACTNLQYVRLSNNRFSGGLDWFGPLSGLRTLDVRGNQYNAIPNSFSRHPALLFLDLSNNGFGGALPELPLPQLQMLFLSGNSFTGAIPASYMALPALTQIDLSDNQLTTIPVLQPGQWANVQCLSLGSNQFSTVQATNIPDAIVNMTALESLAWNNAGLVGDVPPLPLSLRSIDISSNSLSGPFPYSIQNMSSLGQAATQCGPDLDASAPAQVLQLHDNAFTGRLPPAFATREAVRGQWQYLDVANVDLSQNLWVDAPAWCSAANGKCGRRADNASPPSDGAFFNYSKWPILFQGLFLGGGAVFVIGLIAVCVCLRRRQQQRKNNAHSMGYVSAPHGDGKDEEDPDAVHPDIASLAGDVSPGDPLASPVASVDPSERRASRFGGRHSMAAQQPSLTPAGASDAPAGNTSGPSSGVSSPGRSDSGHNSPVLGARALNNEPLLP